MLPIFLSFSFYEQLKLHFPTNLTEGLVSIEKQVAQWATIAHLRASIMFGDTIIGDAERQVTPNLKQ